MEAGTHSREQSHKRGSLSFPSAFPSLGLTGPAVAASLAACLPQHSRAVHSVGRSAASVVLCLRAAPWCQRDRGQ